MPKYLMQASYTTEGVKGLLKDGGTKRKAVFDQTVRGVGGTLEAFYFAFGGGDVVAIADLPDDASATAVSLALSAGGAVGGLNTTVLIDPETVDEAVKKTVEYTPPGR